MKTVREILDPEQTLPEVQLETLLTHDVGYLRRDKFAITENGERIGHCDLIDEAANGRRFAHFDGIEIVEEHNGEPYRGRGYGLAAYILAIELAQSRGIDFETQNYELTQHSKKVWEHLAAKSIAQVVEPFTPSPRFEGRVVGKYRVPVTVDR